ncbi:MAG: DnaD domain protein [Ruminococcus sp.]|nr:DnaD domain protein [Ruminococcus sp.]
MIINIDLNCWGRFFNVPCSIADKYLKLADGDFIKVLLCILSGSSGSVDTEAISAQCGIPEPRVKDAVLYWLGEGVLSSGQKNEPEAEEKPAVAASVPVKQAPEAEKPAMPAPARITLSPKDLAQILDSNPELKWLASEYEKLKGSDIKHYDVLGLINLTEYYGYDVQSLMLLITYCHELGKDSIRYIESVAKDWSSRGVQNYADVEAEIIKQSRIRSYEYKAIKALGLENKPSTNQLKYIHKWQELGISIEMLSIAYDKAMDATGKNNFSYIDKIIMGWSDKNISTPEQVEEADKSFAEKAKKRRNDNENTSYDINKWEEIALNYVPNFKGGNNG